MAALDVYMNGYRVGVSWFSSPYQRLDIGWAPWQSKTVEGWLELIHDRQKVTTSL
ncbi:hypothetical protein [Prodigiosinella confusarubida]|uniref:hypothetical protein n=1 Tax=Serratia sp. (strain ATCC 39006) TaxID=104623 RepID=UPI0003927024|nr:hypothetical protein [Serratia sp. ATCC 39006]